MNTLRIPTRFYRLFKQGSHECDEQDFHYVKEQLEVPKDQAALVLVDCWDNHYARSWLRRAQDIIRNVIVPLADVSRKMGIPVIHAPTEPIARRYAQSERHTDPSDKETSPRYAQVDCQWPPSDFVRRAGDYVRYSRSAQPPDWKDHTQALAIAANLGPQGDDYVVRCGAHLHRVLKHLRVLHLFYAGFATNMCMQHRDYGMRAMAERGYNLILIRDATTAVEAADTVDELLTTRLFTQEIEMKYAYSTTAAAYISAVQASPVSERECKGRDSQVAT